MLKKNDIVELKVVNMTFEGLGVARYSDDEVSDFVVFIHNAVIDDIVDCRIVKVLTRYAYAIIDKIIVPSPDRIVPLCNAFPKCGGCTYINTKYEAELKYKHLAASEAFKKNYPECPITPADVIPSSSIYNYRNKVQYPISENGKFGFFARHSHRTVTIDNCMLQDNDFKRIIHTVEEYIEKYHISSYDEKTGKGLIRHLYLRKAPATGEIMVCLVINGKTLPHKEQFTTMVSEFEKVKSIYININTYQSNVVLGKDCVILWGEETITDVLCGFNFKISPLAFYQTNSPQAANIYNYVIENAGLNENDIVLDLFCGIGTISIAVSPFVKKVIGIEISETAVSNACENAYLNKIKNVDFFAADAENFKTYTNNLPENERPNVIIVDPPRKGLSEQTVKSILNYMPEKLVYISCNPATQARDLKLLNPENQNYNINSIQPFDMFPRTGHVETVVLMSRKDK